MKEILLPHNIKPYEKLMQSIEEKGKACVIQPTGTGKMYLAIKWLMENPSEPFVFLAPTNVILNSFVDKLVELFLPEHVEHVKQLSTKETLAFVNKHLSLNLELMTYAKVNFMTGEEMQEMSVKHVVLDEFHHLGADKWGSSVDRFLEIHNNAEVLGLTATPIRPSDGKDMVEYLFDGEIDSEITLKECFERGILKTPTLINGIYSFEEEIISIENSLKKKNLSKEKLKEVEKKLKQAKQLIGQANHGIRGIFEENLKDFERDNGKLDVKLIVFCNDIADRHKKMDECKTWFKRGTKIKKYSITSEEDKETVNKVIRNFEKDDAKCVKLIFVVDMLNEGLHINGVDGVVMLRSTESRIVFLQQLGRALSVGGQNKKSPLVFDLTNNIEVLAEDIEEVEKTGLTFKRGINEEKGVLEDTIFNLQAEIIDIIEYLKSITYDFQDRIAPLVEYYKRFGSIDKIKQSEPLGHLINDLRQEYKKHKLNLVEIKALEKLGMVWVYHDQKIRPALKSFMNEYLKFIQENHRNPSALSERSLYDKYARYTNPENLTKEEIDYLQENGIKLRKIHPNKAEDNIRSRLKQFVEDYSEFIQKYGRKPKNDGEYENETGLYGRYYKYTNPKNLTKEEIEYLQENGIKIRAEDTIRPHVVNFVKEYLEFIKKYGRKPTQTNPEEYKLYSKSRRLTNAKNLVKEEIEFLEENNIEVREEVKNIRPHIVKFVKDYLEFIKQHGRKPSSTKKEDLALYVKYNNYANTSYLSEEETKYLTSHGINIRTIEHTDNID